MDKDKRRFFSGQFSQRIEYQEGKAVYIGEALPENQGRPEARVWRIKKITYSDGDAVAILWAEGDAGLKYAWDLRAAYSY